MIGIQCIRTYYSINSRVLLYIRVFFCNSHLEKKEKFVNITYVGILKEPEVNLSLNLANYGSQFTNGFEIINIHIPPTIFVHNI